LLPLSTLALHPTLPFTPPCLWPPGSQGDQRGHGPRSLRMSSCRLRARASSPTAGETGQQATDSERHRSFEAQRGVRTRFHHIESPMATATSNPPAPANHDAISTCFFTTATWLGRSPRASWSWSALSAL